MRGTTILGMIYTPRREITDGLWRERRRRSGERRRRASEWEWQQEREEESWLVWMVCRSRDTSRGSQGTEQNKGSRSEDRRQVRRGRTAPEKKVKVGTKSSRRK
jgi:hypothetical protein